jgi:hypothetical protein
MDRKPIYGLDGWAAIERTTGTVHQSTEHGRSDRHTERLAEGSNERAPPDTGGGLESECANQPRLRMTQDLEIVRLGAEYAQRLTKPRLPALLEANIDDAASNAFNSPVHLQIEEQASCRHGSRKEPLCHVD